MRSRAGTVPTNTHNSKVVNVRSIGAQEPALRRRTGLWGAVGNLSEDGGLWLHANDWIHVDSARGLRARPLPRRNYCPGAFARCRAVADPHWSPPQELRATTSIELVGMQATALRTHLLNSALSVRRSGTCGKFSLLISARMGVGHAGVAIKRSSCRQRHGLAVFSAHGQFFTKNHRRG